MSNITETFLDTIMGIKAALMVEALEMEHKIRNLTEFKLGKLRNVTEATVIASKNLRK